MNRFSSLEDSALLGRVESLQRAQRDLDERVRRRGRQAEVEGRWVASDPIYQRLYSVLREVRNQLLDAEQESAKRAGASASRELAGA